MGSMAPEFTLKDEPIENLRPIKVRVIGAGFSGICLGVRIPQRIQNLDFRIYEKNAGVGGVWWENRYPGCACDVPAHSYQYTFETNPQWSEFYASQPEIRQYLHNVAEKYGVLRFLKSRHKVVKCTWDDNAKKWLLVVENLDTGEVFDDDADVVVSSRGNVNTPKWPQIPGLKEFKGELMHSAAWKDGIDFTNKRVGLIGGGSSSVQILPNIQKIEGVKISHFLRSKVWISNPFFDTTMEHLGLDPKVLTFSEEQQKEFSTDPAAYLKFRKTIEGFGIGTHSISLRGSDMQAEMVESLRAVMKEKLAKVPGLFKSLEPSYAAGCRRLIPGPGYLECLVQDNVDILFDKMESVNSTGARLKNGDQVDLDVIICATGFDTSGVPPFEVTGKNGETLQKKFLPFPETYLSLAVDNFPNWFMILGPNAALGAGALTPVLEAQADYVIKCIRKLQKEDYASMMPKKSRVKDFSDFVEAYFKKTVYVDNCHSWYKNDGGQGDRVIGLYPGSTTHFLELLRAPRWEDYEYESKHENRLRWLGNGWSICMLDRGDPTFYLEPSCIDYPPAGTPEIDPKNKLRPWSQ